MYILLQLKIKEKVFLFVNSLSFYLKINDLKVYFKK